MIYKTRPFLKRRSVIAGLLGKQQPDHYEILTGDFYWLLHHEEDSIPLPPQIKFKRITVNSALTMSTEISYISVAEMAKIYEMNAEDLLEQTRQKGLIDDGGITE